MVRYSWMNGGALALALLAVPAAARAQVWPLQVGPEADALTLSAAQFERFRREAPASVDRPTLPPLPAALGPGWMPPPLPAASPPVPRSYRAAAPRRAPAVAAAKVPGPVARTPDLAMVERRLAERERSLVALQRDLAEERRLVESLRSGPAALR